MHHPSTNCLFWQLWSKSVELQFSASDTIIGKLSPRLILTLGERFSFCGNPNHCATLCKIQTFALSWFMMTAKVVCMGSFLDQFRLDAAACIFHSGFPISFLSAEIQLSTAENIDCCIYCESSSKAVQHRCNSLHFPQWMVALCNKIQKLISLPLRKTQTTLSSLN